MIIMINMINIINMIIMIIVSIIMIMDVFYGILVQNNLRSSIICCLFFGFTSLICKPNFNRRKFNINCIHHC